MSTTTQNMPAPKLLWRRGEVESFLGIDSRMVSDLVEAGALKPFYTRRRRHGQRRKAYYFREEVVGLALKWKSERKHD